jgi:hypothetical protein
MRQCLIDGVTPPSAQHMLQSRMLRCVKEPERYED